MSDGEFEQKLAAELRTIEAKLDNKPGVLLTLATMVGVVSIAVIGFAAFLPGRLDTIEAISSDARDASNKAVTEIGLVKTGQQNLLKDFGSLVEAVAEATATGAPDAFGALAQIFPPDVLRAIADEGQLSSFQYNDFNGAEWIFIERARFNSLPSEIQNNIKQSLDRQNVEFRSK